MAMTIFLVLNAIIWTGYSLVCLFSPGLLSGGVVEGLEVFTNPDVIATVEIRAMYGGAQLAIGLLALVTLLSPSMHRPTVITFYVLLFCGLAGARFFGLIVDGPGPGLDTLGGGFKPESYNPGALWAFELPMAIYAIALLINPGSAERGE
jgi:hypothetical protein